MRASRRKSVAVAKRGMKKAGLKRALLNPSIVFTAREIKIMRELTKLTNQPATAARTKRIKTLRTEFLKK
jgi:hypothetical protein